MATQGFTNSFRLGLITGVTHDFSSDTIMAALYTSDATLDADTTAYSATNEVSGTGYTAGGAAVTITSTYPKIVNGRAECRFDNVLWLNSTITARKAQIYNASRGNASIFVIDFGGNVSSTSNTFTLNLEMIQHSMISI